MGSSGAGSRLQGDPESKLFEPFDEVVLGPYTIMETLPLALPVSGYGIR